MLILKRGSEECYGGIDEALVYWTDPHEARLFKTAQDAENERSKIRCLGVSLEVSEGPSPEEIYSKYVDLVRYLTHRMKFSEWVEDAESYLGLIIMTKWDRYDVRVCRRTTWIGREVSGYLLDQRMAMRKLWSRHEKVPRHNPYRPDTKYTELGPQSKIIVDMVREDPEGFRQRFKGRNRQQKLERYMQDLGWSRNEVCSVVSELKEMIR